MIIETALFRKDSSLKGISFNHNRRLYNEIAWQNHQAEPYSRRSLFWNIVWPESDLNLTGKDRQRERESTSTCGTAWPLGLQTKKSPRSRAPFLRPNLLRFFCECLWTPLQINRSHLLCAFPFSKGKDIRDPIYFYGSVFFPLPSNMLFVLLKKALRQTSQTFCSSLWQKAQGWECILIRRDDRLVEVVKRP